MSSVDVLPVKGEAVRGRISIALLVTALGPVLWWVSWILDNLIYNERILFVGAYVFRSRDQFDMNFYLALTRDVRIVAACTVSALGLILLTTALKEAPGAAGVRVRRMLHSVVSINAWFPRTRLGQFLTTVATAVGLVLATGYRAVPSLGNDVVTYIVLARLSFDEAYLTGDLPIRGANPALHAWGAVVRGLSALVGIEPAFFTIAVGGAVLLAIGITRLTRDTLGASPRAAFFASMLGLTLTFGGFGYTLSVPSHAAFFPTPRYLAIAVAVLSLSYVLKGALVRGVLLGLLATSLNTLEGLVPVGLALLAVLITREPSGRKNVARGRQWPLLAGVFIMLSGAALQSGVPVVSAALELILPGSIMIVAIGVGLWVVAWGRPSGGGVLSRSHVIRTSGAGFLFAVGGIFLAAQRSAGVSSGFLENVVLFETILREVRQASSMLLLSSIRPGTALLFVGLGLMAVGLMRQTLHSQVSATSGGEMAYALNAVRALNLLILAGGFVVVGSALLEFTSLPFLVTLWPIRVVWVVVLVAVALVSLRLDPLLNERRIGVLPAVIVGLLLLQGPVVGREGWSVLVIVVLGLLIWVVTYRSDVWSNERPMASATLRVAATIAPLLVLPLLLLPTLSAPEIRVAESAARLEKSSVNAADVAQIARIARAKTPPDARILIPPEARWGAFRLLSDRGVGFEWKNFSSAEPGLWYSQLRWMCDPGYELTADEDFSVGGGEINDCHRALSIEALLEVGRKFDADYLVVPSDLGLGIDSLGQTGSGNYALIRMP